MKGETREEPPEAPGRAGSSGADGASGPAAGDAAPWGTFDLALAFIVVLGPAALAAHLASSVPAASHDEAVIRVVGLGSVGPLRALDALVAAPAMLAPIGTAALRAALASAIVTGVAASVAFVVARRFIADVTTAVFARWPGGAVSPKLASAVAAVSVLGAALGPSWQAEGSAPGGAVTGALLVVLVLAQTVGVAAPSMRAVALLLGLAASYEPLALLAASLAALPAIVAWRPRRAEVTDAAIALVLGLAPLGLSMALARRAPGLVLPPGPLVDLSSERGLRAVKAASTAELGAILVVCVLAGAALSAGLTGDRTRRALASLAGVALAGALSVGLGAPPTSAPALAAIMAAFVVAGITLAAFVVALARAPVPFAQASAALVVVLELVLPVRAADETLGKREAHASRGSATWTELAWGPAPPCAVVLVPDRMTMRRVMAARALGDVRPDLIFVPTFDIGGPAARRALATEPKLAPLYRDITLGSPPEELSLAQLAGVRALLTGFDPRWDRALARHLVPIGLSTRFEPEPRGTSDRRRAMDEFTPAKDRLVRVAVARRDPHLAAATAAPLRARAIAMAACGERDMLSRALDDLRPFAPDDAVANALVRRTVTSKGAIDVQDLAP